MMEIPPIEENPERHTPGLAGRTTRTTTTTTIGGNISEGTDRVNDSGNNTGTSANDRHDYRFDIIPESLKDLPQWGVWRREYTDGKPNNVPYDAKTGNHLSVTDPGTWSPFAVALEAYQRGIRGQWDGLSVVLKEGGQNIGLDVDECVDECGDLTPEAREIVTLWGSYLEYSPSRRGLRGFAFGTLPAGRRKVGHYEIYDSTKVLTVTGWHLSGSPTTLETRPDAIREIHKKFFTKPKKQPATGTFNPDEYEPFTDDEILDLATCAKNGARVQALINSDFAGYASNSEADLAACNYLAFYCGPNSHEQIDRIFRAHFSGFRPAKWDKRHYANGDSYGKRTVQVALEGRTEFYTRPRTKAARGVDTHATDKAHAPIDLPKLKVTANLTEMVDAAENALIKNFPKPVLYQRARIICRIAPAGDPPKWLQRPPDTPIIVRADTISLREYSGQSGQWVKHDKRAKEWLPVLPPAVVFEALAARPTWKFPHLEGIIGAPTLRPDGVLVHKAGYDKETGLYLDLNGVEFPPVPDTPTREDAKAALDILYTPFSDFPFQDDCHRAATLAAVLTVVGRFAIPGSVPAFVARAHAKGSGKGLLVNTIATIGTGRTAPTWTQTLDEAEEGKRLLSIALAGDAVMHIDNIAKPFGSAKLDSALTSATVKDRLLGANINQEAPWLTVVFASGNNLTFVGDMVRRVVPINLDPKVEHPEERTDFRHTPLLAWVLTERPRLVTAALTALKAFFHAGCPKQPNVSEFGSFEQWSNIIRHSLIWAGFPDPCGGRKHLEEESDTSYEALATLLHCWADCYPDTQARTLKVITQDVERRQIPDPSAITPANEWNALHDALSAYDTKYDGKRLDTRRIGNAMRTIEGTVLGNQRLIRAGESKNVALWKRELLK